MVVGAGEGAMTPSLSFINGGTGGRCPTSIGGFGGGGCGFTSGGVVEVGAGIPAGGLWGIPQGVLRGEGDRIISVRINRT